MLPVMLPAMKISKKFQPQHAGNQPNFNTLNFKVSTPSTTTATTTTTKSAHSLSSSSSSTSQPAQPSTTLHPPTLSDTGSGSGSGSGSGWELKYITKHKQLTPTTHHHYHHYFDDDDNNDNAVKDKKYLMEHNIPMLFDHLLCGLLRHKPEDEIMFLSRYGVNGFEVLVSK